MLLFASRNAGKRECACVGVWLVLVKKAKSSDCCGSLLPLQTLFLWIRICPLTRFTGPIGARIKSPSSSVAKFQSCAHRSDNLTPCKNYTREKAGKHVVRLEVRKVGMMHAGNNSIVLSISHKKEPRAESIWPKTLKISVTSHSAGSKGFAWVCTKSREPWREGGGCMMYMMVDDDDLNDESFQCFDIFLSSLTQIIAQSWCPGQSKADDLQSAAILSKVSLRTLQC